MGLFFFGQGTTALALGNGLRCVSAPQLFRLPVRAAGGSVLSFAFDNTQVPAAGQIMPGSTWHFQAYFRDPQAGPARFNLTDALTVTFVP